MDIMSYLMGQNNAIKKGMKVEVVTELPDTGVANVIYLVPKEDTGDNDIFDEYLWVDNDWEHIGSTDIDLSNYYTKAQVDSKIPPFFTLTLNNNIPDTSSDITDQTSKNNASALINTLYQNNIAQCIVYVSGSSTSANSQKYIYKLAAPITVTTGTNNFYFYSDPTSHNGEFKIYYNRDMLISGTWTEGVFTCTAIRLNEGMVVDVINYAKKNTAQTFSAKQTFSVLPESSVVPTTDDQLVNKKYVDDNSIQYSTMPTADATTVGKMIQYTGTTDANYTNGYFYIGTTDGDPTPTYSWERLDVQPGAVYTAGDGVNITNNKISVNTPIHYITNSTAPLVIEDSELGIYVCPDSTGFQVTGYSGGVTAGFGLLTGFIVITNNVIDKTSATYQDVGYVQGVVGDSSGGVLKQYFGPLRVLGTTGKPVLGQENSYSTVLTWGNATISGVKTFSTLPESSVTPTTNNQLTNKKYVDSKTTQYSTMPTADSTTVGKIVQYIGATTNDYTNGYFYIGATDGESTPTYSWAQLDVQPSGSSDPVPIFVLEDSNNYNTNDNKTVLLNIIAAINNGVGPVILLHSRYQNAGWAGYPTYYYLAKVRSFGPSSITLTADCGVSGSRQTAMMGVTYQYSETIWISANYSNNTITSVSTGQDAFPVPLLTWGDASPIAWGNSTAFTPTNDYNVANKKYVDDAISSAITTTLGGSY